MSTEPTGTAPAEDDAGPRRLFLREPGWKVAQKAGSEREHCFIMAPGQDFYHRLQDGEIYIYRGNERLCAACAERRGLLTHEAKSLREPIDSIDFDAEEIGSEFDLKMPDAGGQTSS